MKYLNFLAMIAVTILGGVAFAGTEITTPDGQCLAIAGARLNRGAAIVEHGCNDHLNQDFQISPRPSGYFEIRSARSQLCLDLPAGTHQDGASYQQWECGGADSAPNQEFSINKIPGGFLLRNRFSGKCVAIEAGRLVQEECDQSLRETFNLEKVDLPLLPVVIERGSSVCNARNRSGRVFPGRAESRADARERAINNCYSHGSEFCYPIEGSCREIPSITVQQERVAPLNTAGAF